MDVLIDLFSSRLAQRIGWALVHFLWQGTVVALVLAAAMRLLRRGSAQARWVAACAALGLMAMLPVVTACTISGDLSSATEAAPRAETVTSPNATTVAASETGDSAASADRTPAAVGDSASSESPASVPSDVGGLVSSTCWVQRVRIVIGTILPWGVLVWLIGVAGMSVWQLAGWRALGRIKRSGVRTVGPVIRDKFDRMRRRLRMSRPVRLLQSTHLVVPIVVGWLRPVVLLPVSAISGLTPTQLEAVLAHELAHIRRFDYLVRLMQAVVETVLFYHPAVWWVSGRIREEGEHCCDDWAVRLCPDRHSYARALVRAAELVSQSQCPRLAPAAVGGKLLPRIRRILGLPDVHPGGSARWLSGGVMLVTLLVAALFIYDSAASGDSQPPGGQSAHQPTVQPGDVRASEPAKFSGRGSGTEESPYVITNIHELQEVHSDLGGHYVLDADIDASGTRNWNGGQGFVPIGLGTEGFKGSFDGKGHSINDLYIDRLNSEYQGLFAALSGATVKHIKLINATLRCDRGGILAARAGNGSVIAGCAVTGTVTLRPGSDDAKTGGLIGSVASGARVDQCFSGVDLQADRRRQVGSLIGYLQGKDVAWPRAVLSNSYSYGTVTGNGWKQGNLLGDADGGRVDRCYSSGYKKALNGFRWASPVITNCYWDNDRGAASSPRGGAPQSTAAMMRRATFVGWDFTEVWEIAEGRGYPRLRVFAGKQGGESTGQTTAPRPPRTALAAQSTARPTVHQGIAWGPAAAGLQAGIRTHGGKGSLSCEIGDKLILDLYLRNVAGKTVKYLYLDVNTRAWRPRLADEEVHVPGSIIASGGRASTRTVSLAPGECWITTSRFAVVNSAWKGQTELAQLRVEPGEYRIVYAPKVFSATGEDAGSWQGDAGELASGGLDLKVLPAKESSALPPMGGDNQVRGAGQEGVAK